MRGIAFALGREVIHGTITPENVYLGESGTVKIEGFGMAGVLKLPNKKVNYQTPESLEHQAVEAPADIWAIGLILHELATGRKVFDCKPYISNHLEEIQRQICDQEPARLPCHYSKGTKSLVWWMLSKKPADRPTPKNVFELKAMRQGVDFYKVMQELSEPWEEYDRIIKTKMQPIKKNDKKDSEEEEDSCSSASCEATKYSD